MTYPQAISIVSDFFDRSVMTPDETEAFQLLLKKLSAENS